MLPSIVPKARIFEFLYPKKDASIQNLKNLAGQFLTCCSNAKITTATKFEDKKLIRPVIFIAYGNGGHVLELATIISYSKRLSASEATPSKIPPPPAAVQATKPVGRSSTDANTSNPKSKATVQKVLEKPRPVDKQEAPHDNMLSNPSISENGEDLATMKYLNLSIIAGIVFLGSPIEVPVVAAKGITITKLDESPLEKRLEACMKTEFKRTKEFEEPESTIFHTCFEMIVNKIGLSTQWYQGNNLFQQEAGNHFKVS